MAMDWTRKCPENRPSWSSSSREWGWDIPLTLSAPRTRPTTTPASTGTVCSPTHRPDRRWGTRSTWIRCPHHPTTPLQDTRSPCLRIRALLPPGMINLKWKSFELTERAKRWGNLELYTQAYNCSNWIGASSGHNTWPFPSARNSPHPLASRKHRLKSGSKIDAQRLRRW